MDLRGKRILVCSCEKTMALDEAKLRKACRAAGAEGELELNSQLCRAQLGNFQKEIIGDRPVLVACTQEAPLFAEIAAEDNPRAQLSFTNIRERAGWSAEGAKALPKMVALIAEAALDMEPTPALEMKSEGICLVYGKDERAIEAAKQLAGRLDVSVMLTGTEEIVPPGLMDVPVFRGSITQASGHLGKFGINVDGYAPAVPSSRQALAFEAPRSNAFSECDLILDLSGGAPLFPAHEKRDGYLRPDPDDPVAVQKAVFEIADMIGEFEKPLYINYKADICVHGRSGKTGCSRCLDVCPASAIEPAGDLVEIDPHLCGGCGACASVCPTGAADYQFPAGDGLFQRLRTLLGAYRAAGGPDPVLLLHDTRHGEEMIGIVARAGRGLPANVIPFPLNEVTQVGLDFLASALAYGAGQICLLVNPAKRDELAGLGGQIGLAEAVMEGLGYGGGRIHLLDDADPEKIEATLYGLKKRDPAPAGEFLPIGGKRARLSLALAHLHGQAPNKVDTLPLPAEAPFGTLVIDTKGCTLCLACVGACPTGALQDNPDKPWLGFKEEACVQCGLCRATCPESVIELEPRLNFTEEARRALTIREEEPFECIRCGKPFGVKSTIERISAQLAGKHELFADSDQAARIKMCEDCRVIVQFEATDDPFKGPDRPKPRTTEDYFREAEIEEARAKVLAEREDAEKAGGGNGHDPEG